MPALGQIDIVLNTIDGHVQPFSFMQRNCTQRAATKLMSLCTDTVQQKKRLGQATVNLFNRGYNMVSQLQIESGQQLCLTTDEMASVSDLGRGVHVNRRQHPPIDSQHDQLATGLHLGTTTSLCQFNKYQDHNMVGTRHSSNGLEYTGVQAFDKMPAEVQQHLNQILENQHPLQQGIQIPYWGAKTTERLRGNQAVLEHVNSNRNMPRYIEEFNSYHGPTPEDDQQMEG